jgi:hypothetical protein
LDCRPEPYISDRWPIAQEIYDSVQASAQFVTYPGVAHTITFEMFEDVKNFFASHKPLNVKPASGGILPAIYLLLDQ